MKVLFLPHHFKLLTIVTIAVTFTLSGCGNKKITSCNLTQEIYTELTNNVNQYINSENPQDVAKVGDVFIQAQEKLSANGIKDENLSPLTQKLGEIYRQYNQVTNQYLSAYEARDREEIIQSKQQLNQLFQEQKEVIQEINSYCVN